jgi:hypothetical protein
MSLYSWEIINPSDRCTLQARDFPTAAASCQLLGEGRYGLDPERDDQPRCPLLIFGGHEDFIAEHFGGDLSQWIDGHLDAIVECLDSVLLGDFSRRADYDAAVAAIDDPIKLAAFRRSWADKRSSLNDICGRAAQIADGLRSRSAEVQP